MTDISAKPRANRYRLRTFGTLALAGAQDDALLGAHGHQHGRLALLAVLAAAGDEGRSRDQLLLLFWPDATQSRARHSLDQLLYAVRSSIDEDLFAGVSPVRLNPAVVSSDVREFQGALERGDLEGAVAQYRGPFLDGFHLTDALEFERWLDTERAHLERSYADALQRLARSADASSDHAAAVRWWRRLTDVDPVSNTNAVGLIRALMSAGDLGAALQHAERYEGVVSQELGTNAGPEVAKLVAEVRERTKGQRVAVVKSAPPPPPPPPPPRLAPHVAPAPDDATEPPAQPRLQNVSRRRSVSYAVAAGAALGIVLIAAIAWLAIARRPTALPVAAERSIAVLPFANVSGDQHDAPLVDGLSEELIAVLAKIPNLQVVARTSAFAFRNSNAGARRIADSLGVRYLLEGGVQRAASRLRVQVRLVDARDGSTRWSETYDRTLQDIFSVQSDIAGSVARQLDLRLGINTLARIKRGSTSNIAAYELYLRGSDPALTRSDSAARAGSEYFSRAIALDPGYAAAYAGLARMQLRITFGDDKLSRTDRRAIAEQAARKAVALDDSLGEAHAALSLVATSKYHLASAEREIMRAVSLEPTNARFREWLIQLLIFTERPGEALVEARRALELDPLSPTVNAELAHALLANDRCDEALPLLAKLQSLRPPLLRAHSIAAQCYARKRMWPEAIAEVQRSSAAGGSRVQALLGYMLGRAGRTSEAKRILATLLERSRRINGGAFDVATLYAGLGEYDQAFAWLDRALDDRSLALDHLPIVMTTLPRGPRLDTFRRRLGLRSDSAARAGAGTPTPPELSSTKNQ